MAIWQADTTMLTPLDESSDRELHGPKAATLAVLRAAGFPVPDGWVLPVGADAAIPTLDGVTGRLAVRSSAIDEDGAESSSAGLHRSILGVEPTSASLTEAARAVVESSHGRPIAVLIQPMIDPIAAGAAFTRNPVTGDHETVVSSIAGLADQLMEGSVSGSEWVVRGDAIELVSGDEARTDIVLGVADLAGRVEDHLGYPVDIEWAHDGTTLHLLQARPITALPIRPDLRFPDGNWEKDATHHPGPLAPLVASLLDNETEMMTAWAARAGLMIGGLEQVTVGGELYVRPIPLVGSPDATGTPPWWAVALLARIHPAIRRQMAAAEAFMDTPLFRDPTGMWKDTLKPELSRRVDGLRTVDLGALDDPGLLAHIDDVRAFARWAGAIHFDLFVPYLIGMHEFVALCDRLLGLSDAEAMSLLAGASPASSEPTRAMSEVARIVAASPSASAVFDDDGPDTMSRLRQSDAAVDEALAQWIERHGFRTMNYDWSSPTLGEQEGTILAMLRAELRASTRILDAGDAIAEARARLSGDARADFDAALQRALDVSPVREDNVVWTALVPGALHRRAYLEVGRRLVARGRLADPDDVFHLEAHEAHTALADEGEWMELVRRRQAERRWVLAHPGPAFLGVPPSPAPDLRGLPAGGRAINSALMWGLEAEFGAPAAPSDDDGIQGLAAAPGTHTGPARIVRTEADFGRVEPGDVVVCPITNPAWSVLFGIAGAFVCDAGGPLSHTAILAREYDIPSVLAVGDATARIPDGATVTVDGTTGRITI